VSKKRPSPVEARWRANYRYRRELAKWRAEEADGDLLGLAADLRKRGVLAQLAKVVLATGSSRDGGGGSQKARTAS
jgi:hypothetical protein